MTATAHRAGRPDTSETMIHPSLHPLILSVLALTFSPAQTLHGKKIRQSLKITAQDSCTQPKETADGNGLDASIPHLLTLPSGDPATFIPDSIRFAGYDKEASASKETFLIINNSPFDITALRLKIVYRDIQGRMLHSRTIHHKCTVPHGETRKTDISSWDTQHSYFYHLSNEPRKSAAPYKVEFIPLSFFVRQKE